MWTDGWKKRLGSGKRAYTVHERRSYFVKVVPGVLLHFRVFPQTWQGCSAGPLPPGRERPCLITKCTQPLANHCMYLLFARAFCVIAYIASVYHRKSTIRVTTPLKRVRVRVGHFEMTTTNCSHLGS